MSKAKTTEFINLMPEGDGKSVDDSNYISMSFYEHDYSVQKYLKRRVKQKFEIPHIDTVIRFPFIASSQTFRISLTIGGNPVKLDFVKNLAYEALTENNDPDSIERALQESINSPLREFKEIITDDNLPSNAREFAIGKAVAETLKGDSSGLIRGSKFTTGVAYNPNTRHLYDLKEAVHRVFMLNFNLFAKNEAEMKNIRRAEYLLLHHSIPTQWTGTAENQVFSQFDGIEAKYINHFKYPKKVQPTVYIGGKEFRKFKFMESVITNISLTPAAEDSDSDVTFIKNDGNQIFAKRFVISLTLQESKMFTRNDVEHKKNEVSKEDILEYSSKGENALL